MLRENISQKSNPGAVIPTLTPYECLRLNELPYMAQVLYAISLRPRLDDTGVAGSFWVDQGWSLVTGHWPVESPVGVPDRATIQSMLNILEERGLIQQLQPDNPWAFKVFCPLAMSSSYRKRGDE